MTSAALLGSIADMAHSRGLDFSCEIEVAYWLNTERGRQYVVRLTGMLGLIVISAHGNSKLDALHHMYGQVYNWLNWIPKDRA